MGVGDTERKKGEGREKRGRKEGGGKEEEEKHQQQVLGYRFGLSYRGV